MSKTTKRMTTITMRKSGQNAEVFCCVFFHDPRRRMSMCNSGGFFVLIWDQKGDREQREMWDKSIGWFGWRVDGGRFYSQSHGHVCCCCPLLLQARMNWGFWIYILSVTPWSSLSRRGDHRGRCRIIARRAMCRTNASSLMWYRRVR